MNSRLVEPSTIAGWGIDADPDNDPTYPMRHRSPDQPRGYTWRRPVRQEVDVEVLHSNERPDLPAVFGTSVPPSGLSGHLRRVAFRYSESSYGHWLPLMLADRINMIEGLVDDLSTGHVPNIPAERGWQAAWTHDRQTQVFKLGAMAVAVMAAMVFMTDRQRADSMPRAIERPRRRRARPTRRIEGPRRAG